MLKKLIFTFLLFYTFFNFTGKAQNIELKCRVIEQETNEPLSFVTVEIRSLAIGTYTDIDGYFTITVPEKNQKDTISLYALGYEKKKMLIKELVNSENKTIELKQKYFNIKEVNVKPKKTKVIKLGVKQKKTWKYQIANIFGAQIAQYIRNDNHVSGFIKSVSFYITEVGHTNTPFRVRIYGYDKANNCPGEDLLNKDLIVQNTHGAGWFTVDISDYYIRFPQDGMFVAMEWVYTNDKYYYTHEITVYGKDGSKKVIMNSFYGLSLGNISKQKNIGVWSTRLGDKWIKWDQYYKGYINVMINAEIEVEK